MIGKAIIGKGFSGCVAYCLDEKKNPRILMSAGLAGKCGKALTSQLVTISQLRPNLSNPVWHAPISFAHSDEVSNDLMVKVAMDYLREMKLDQNQWLVIRHNDTKHDHMHIIANRVGFDAQVARDWKSKHRTKIAMKKLGRKYDLVIAEDQGNKRKESIKEQIQLGLSNQENIERVFERIEKLGYKILFNKGKNGNVRGVSFLDKSLGIQFKSSAIDREYSFAGLQKLTKNHGRNETKGLSR